MDQIIAVPADSNEGLSAVRSDHFARAPYFAVARASEGEDAVWVDAVAVDSTPDGRHGVPAALKRLGVTDVVTMGIGQGMVDRLDNEGIRIWIERSGESVADVVAAFVAGGAAPLSSQDIGCAGDAAGGCH